MSYPRYIQFRGIEKVLECYNLKKIDTWAIFQDKQLLHVGEGADELEQFLEMLLASACPYTLKLYSKASIEDVTDKLACNSSYNFKLTKEEDDPQQKKSYINDDLEKRLRRIEAMGGIEEEPETLEEAAIGLLKNPTDLAELVNTVKGIFGLPPGYVPQSYQQSATMSGTQPGEKNNFTETDLARLEKTLDVLHNCDNKIVDHLEKLSHIAQTNPGQFKFLLNALDNM